MGISKMSITVNQEIGHFVVVVANMGDDCFIFVEGHARKLPFKLHPIWLGTLVSEEKFVKANQKVGNLDLHLYL